MKVAIKTRVWLLGMVVLGGMLGLLALHYRSSAAELAQHGELTELLRQTDHYSRAIHELQRERGLSSGYLTSRDEGAYSDLQAQYAATDFGLRDLHAALPKRKQPLAAIDAMRRRVATGEASLDVAFDYYTVQIAAMLDGVDQLALAAGESPLRMDLYAHAQLIRAKEFLGQARATLQALPIEGGVNPSRIAAMGRHVGLFEWHAGLFLQRAGGDLASTLRGVLAEPDMLRVHRLIDEAVGSRSGAAAPVVRKERYETMTAVIDQLREVERHSLATMREKAEAEQSAAYLRLMVERSALLLLSGLLIYLALSSLRQMMTALEAALRGARRAARGRTDPGAPEAARRSDEVGEISRGFGDLLELVDRLTRKASTDALTGALNRHGFGEAAEAELLRAQRYQRKLSMIMFDLDHFKAVNDRHGHAVGDRVLQEAARLVDQNLRLADVFARWGGEEFIILAPETSAGEAECLAEKLRQLFHEARAEGLPRFTASFGVAAHEPGDDAASLAKRADRALYQAKQGGRDRVVLDRPEAPTVADPRRRMAVVSDNTRRGASS